MGVDIPWRCWTTGIRFFSYFKQLFAQVTNPPMDAIREEIQSPTPPSTRPMTGICSRNSRTTAGCSIHNPVLTSTDLMKIKAMNRPGFHAATVSLLYYKGTYLDRYWTGWRWRWTGRTGRGPTLSSFPTGGWTRTTRPSPLCWRCLPWSSTWFAPGSAPPYLSSWNPLSPGRSTTSPPCWAMAPGQ